MKVIKKIVLYIIVFLCSFSFLVRAETMNIDSAQFAAQSETKTFIIKHNDFEEIADRLREPGVRIKSLLSRNILVVHALQEKMKEIKKKLKKIDSPTNPYQVKYNLYIIKLKSERFYGMRLRDMELKKNNEDGSQFLTKKDLVEFAGEMGISYLRSHLEKSQLSMQKLVQSSLIAGIDTTASITLNREIVNLVEEKPDFIEKFTLKLTPESVIQKSKQVESTINFSSSAFTNSKVVSNIKTKYNKPELIAVFSQKKNKNKKTSFKSFKENRETNYFALYLTANPIGILPNNDRVFNLDGLGNILDKKDVNEPTSERIDILYNSNIEIDILSQNSKERRGFNIKLRKQHKTNSFFFQIGPDFYLMDDLKLGTYFQVKDGTNRFKVGLKDRVKIRRGFYLSAGYYPWFYNFNDNKIVEEKNWWLQSRVKYKRVFLDLKYNEIETSIIENYWQGLLGWQISNPVSIVIGVKKDKDGKRKYIGGFNFKI